MEVSAIGEEVKRVVRVGSVLVARARRQLSSVANICG